MSDPFPTDQATLDPALQLPHRRKMQILGAVLLVMFLSALDQTIVGVALPRIVGDLQGTNELYTWAITSYLLAATITGVFYGKLSDIFGRRPMLLIGVSIFLIGSVLCGLSWSMESLIVFRGLQGVGAGAIFPISLAIIGDLFDPRERGRYQGLFGAVFGLASVLGPLLGGWITDNIGWHWIFFVNVPLGIVALFVVYRLLPAIKDRDRSRKLDLPGAAVFAVGVFFLLLGLTNKATGQWSDLEVGGYLLIAAALTPLFLFIESRAAEPIIPLDLFRNRNYAVSILATFLAAIGFFGAIIFLPRWLQFVQNVSPTESGLQILPLMAGVILGSIGAGILVSRTGSYKWILTGALVLMSVGIFLFTSLSAGTEMPSLWLWMFLAGIGIGPTLSVFTIVIQSSVPFTRLGVATGNLTFFRQVGGSVGLAIVGTLFADSFADRLAPSLTEAGVPGEQAAAISSFADASGGLGQVNDTTLAEQLGQIPALQGFVDQVVAGIYGAFSGAIADTFWFGLGTTMIALLVVTIALKDLPLRQARPAPAVEDGVAETGAVEAAS
jgi:EmrB/QacA subfamily drug resistance transporter